MKKTDWQEIIFNSSAGKWKLTIDFNNQITVAKNKEKRVYDLKHKVIKVETGDEYVYLEIEGGGFYQFKFEENSFLVGDLFDKDSTHIDTVASHVFGEESIS